MNLFDDNENVDLFTLHDDDGWNVLHFASAYSKHSLDLLNFLLDHPKCSTQAVNMIGDLSSKKIVRAEENTQPDPWVDVVFFFFDFIT